MSIQCDTDSSFTIGIQKQANSWKLHDIFFDSYELEISTPSAIDGLDVLYSVSELTLSRLYNRILEEREVIVGIVGFDLFRSTLLGILSQMSSELNSVLSQTAPN